MNILPAHSLPRAVVLVGVAAALSFSATLAARAARGESPAAFERRCIPPGGVAPPSNIPDILGRHALPSGRLRVLGATPDFPHGLRAARGGLSEAGILVVPADLPQVSAAAIERIVGLLDTPRA